MKWSIVFGFTTWGFRWGTQSFCCRSCSCTSSGCWVSSENSSAPCSATSASTTSSSRTTLMAGRSSVFRRNSNRCRRCWSVKSCRWWSSRSWWTRRRAAPSASTSSRQTTRSDGSQTAATYSTGAASTVGWGTTREHAPYAARPLYPMICKVLSMRGSGLLLGSLNSSMIIILISQQQPRRFFCLPLHMLLLTLCRVQSCFFFFFFFFFFLSFFFLVFFSSIIEKTKGDPELGKWMFLFRLLLCMCIYIQKFKENGKNEKCGNISILWRS